MAAEAANVSCGSLRLKTLGGGQLRRQYGGFGSQVPSPGSATSLLCESLAKPPFPHVYNSEILAPNSRTGLGFSKIRQSHGQHLVQCLANSSSWWERFCLGGGRGEVPWCDNRPGTARASVAELSTQHCWWDFPALCQGTSRHS